ncbi:p53-like transcription factor [Xylona heveae TC161]|uniref:p53-like transcription factor n=1 Tax=Xylona heveae (strain CBS 132557 / TC161) TaxID=1328760 RepID=A0A165IVF2_XYLHT|nr:p53-like transcription factor [Xylona heveae TC161]KZF25442.1 p53-like transcription factor [Xylona heveae TC161]
MSPVNSSIGSASTSPSSAASSLAFSPFMNVYQPGLSGTSNYSASPSVYSNTPNYSQSYAMSDVRPRISSIHGISGMPPPSRSPSAGHAASPSSFASARDNYTTSTPHLNRHTLSPRQTSEVLYRSPRSPQTSTPRTSDPAMMPLSSNAANTFNGATPAGAIDTPSQLGFATANQSPPFGDTVILHSITSVDGTAVTPQIHARIEKGFFFADHDWTCYRRNYFSVNCSYSLRPHLPSVPLFLTRSTKTGPEPIQGFAISIAAVVDGPGGKSIELVQHTPKRDKAPTSRPEPVKVEPNTSGVLGMFPSSGSHAGLPFAASHLTSQSEYDQSFTTQHSAANTSVNFERIQFKNATANNGKRRAAQQYYHLIVELYAEVRGSLSSDAQFVKIATRISERMVVRGRSPGHYSEDRRTSSSSAGPGGASGSGDSMGGLRSTANSLTGSRGLSTSASLFGNSGSVPGGGSYRSYTSPSTTDGTSQSVSSSSSSIDVSAEHSLEPIIAGEDSGAMDDYTGYHLYSQGMFEPPAHQLRVHSVFKDDRFIEPSAAPFDGEAIRNLGRFSSISEAKRLEREETLATQQPPMFGNPWPNGNIGESGRGCGRLRGVQPSRGYYSDISTAL